MHLCILDQLRRATQGRCEGSAHGAMPLRRMTIDSREVQAGDVFWALPGKRHDGAEFIADAFRRGAWGCVLADRGTDQVRSAAANALQQACGDGQRFLLWVPDVAQALSALAAWHRRRLSARVIAVTGSVGKTTTRDMVHTALQSRLCGVRSPKNYNNQLGVPLSLLQVDREHDFAVLELGASAVGEIAGLCDVCRPQIGLFTRIAPAHLAGFGGLAQVAKAKGELLAALPSDGLAIMNGDDAELRRMAKGATCPVVFVGTRPGNDWTARDLSVQPGRLRFEAVRNSESSVVHVDVPVNGGHFVTSALLALATAAALGVAPVHAAKALEDFVQPPSRCQRHDIGGVTLLDDSYNASPASMQAALQLLADWPTAGRRIVVCGDMAELGDDSTRYHQQLGTQAAAAADCLFAVGQFADTIVEAWRGGHDADSAAAFADRETLVQHLKHTLRRGDVVLVKGSRTAGLDQVGSVLMNADWEAPAFTRPSRQCAVASAS